MATRLLRVWLLTALIYGVAAALLIYLAIPRAYDAGVLSPRPGWDVARYQKSAVPRALIGFVLLGGVLTFTALQNERRQSGPYS